MVVVGVQQKEDDEWGSELAVGKGHHQEDLGDVVARSVENRLLSSTIDNGEEKEMDSTTPRTPQFSSLNVSRFAAAADGIPPAATSRKRKKESNRNAIDDLFGSLK